MCGRFWKDISWEEYRAALDLYAGPPPTNLAPNWNIAPTQTVEVCVEEGGKRQLEPMRWGLIPIWAKEVPKFATFNAKAEGLEEKATWKGSLNRMRCVVPASGFYEWKGPKGEKQPYAIRRRDGEPLLFAGLWAFNDKTELGEVRSFTIITVPPNASMATLHNRMPAVLEREDAESWLAGPWDEERRSLVRPCGDDVLTAYPVAKEVGAVRNNSSRLPEATGEPVF